MRNKILFNLFWRSALGLVLLLNLFYFVRPVQADESGVTIFNISQEDLNADDQPDLTRIECAFATAYDLIYVIDQNQDMQLSKNWREATDFKNDVWLYDIGADGSIQLIVVYKIEKEHAVAYVYDDRDGDGKVEYDRTATQVTVLESPHWIARIISDSDWFLPDGRVNLNIRIQIDGPVPTLDRAPQFFIQDWMPQDGYIDVEFEEVAGPDGIAHYALKRLDTDSPWDAGFERTGLLSNEGRYPTRLPERAFFPLLPAPMERQGTKFRSLRYFDLPPSLTLDWINGRVLAVGLEGYPIGHGYHFNDNMYIVKGRVNDVSFESPQAYYDLANNHDAFAEMHIRFFTRPTSDSTMWALPGKESLPWQSIRYDWNLFNPGTFRWDFKVGVGGNYTIDSIVQFRDFAVRAVPFEELPYWITEREWKSTTFVAREGEGYESSEGIYEWQTDTGDDPQVNAERAFAAREATFGYMLGAVEQPPDAFFQTTHPGFRAERRFTGPIKPRLYFSPLDHKLHLLGAEAGIWTIDDNNIIRYANLDKDSYLDEWSYFKNGKLQQAFHWVGNHLIYSDENEVWLKRTNVAPSLFETLPPRNHKEWVLQRQQLEANRQEFVPEDLKAMVAQFSGPDWGIERAALRDFRPEGAGFHFILDLKPGFRSTGPGGPNLNNLSPGTYVVNYQKTFTILPLSPAAPSLALLPVTLTRLQMGSIPIQVSNDGLEDIPQATLELWATSPDGDTNVVADRTIELLAQKTTTETLLWAPISSGTWVLTPKLRQPDGRMTSGNSVSIRIAPSPKETPLHLLSISTSSPRRIPVIPLGLMILATLAAVLFWYGWAEPLTTKITDEEKALTPKQNQVLGMTCPRCQIQVKQRKAGFNRSGSQRYRCGLCRRAYTPNPSPAGYPVEVRMLAVRMYRDGNSYNVIARALDVSPQSVNNWVKQYTANLPVPVSRKPIPAELHELFRVIDQKKRNLLLSDKD